VQRTLKLRNIKFQITICHIILHTVKANKYKNVCVYFNVFLQTWKVYENICTRLPIF
jgi:hypothetical protein